MTGFRGAGRIEVRPVETVKPCDRNARKQSNAQLDKFASSIQAFGFNAPILIDRNNLVVATGGLKPPGASA
jgi:hypothetical protein